MQFFDTTIPIIAILLGSVMSSLLLALPLYRYKGKISESSFLLRLALLILLAFGVGTTVFVSFVFPVYLIFAFIFVLPFAVCFILRSR
ncbi:MAG: hypothetical protein AM326_08365 [Candidatus Thorarchaeota archaeon SMTZ-45]|nr:MAG: hypothetical protein AM325_00670 [Candidatus Thorarchaeota archaeon SMTZ1-45]KXH75879.1 MAG: hypothetical protein AM326_08365 [Candidatus Thorarchaeota archaeon SMTZ-45]